MSQNSPLKIAIYSPYLETTGGGEKYMMTIAEILSQDSIVDVLLDDNLASLDIKAILGKLENMHGLNLSKINLVKAPLSPKSSALSKYLFLKKYDVFICNTDGSIFYASAKRNFIHFQVPFENTNALGVKGKIKMSSWERAIYNSKFTQEIIEKSWPIKGEVVYPPVSTNRFKPTKKKKQILTVGRFFSVDKSKKQSLMINTFKELISDGKLKGWNLAIAGGQMKGDEGYVDDLKKLAKGLSVDFYVNAPLKGLQDLYGQSSIYWHAKGFEEENPRDYEHFGITTVEAMAAGCVPVVINLGGQPEIVEDGENGFLWDTLDQLKEKTLQLAGDEKVWDKMSKSAIKSSENFDKKHFEEKIRKLVYG